MQYPDVQTMENVLSQENFRGMGWDEMKSCPITLKSFNLSQLYNK